MAGLNDEILMAYADGQLDPAENSRVEDLLAHDPALRERLRIFTEAGKGLSLLFEDHLRAPMPPRLKPFASPIKEQPRIITAIADRLRSAAVLARLQDLLKPENSAFRFAFASGIALVAGIGLAISLLRHPDTTGDTLSKFVQISQDRLIARGPLRQLLETSPSGRAMQVTAEESDKTQLKAKLTFKNQTDDYCREFVIRRQAREGYAGIACRKNGQWRIAMQAAMMPQPNSGGIAPAGSSKAHQAVEAAVLAMIKGNSLGKDEEAAALRAGWETK
jgi:anti-sigma factor RsiW